MTDYFLDTVQGTVTDGAAAHLELFHHERREGYAGTLETFVDERKLPRFSVHFDQSSGYADQPVTADMAEPGVLHDGAQVIAVMNLADRGVVKITPAP